MTDDAAAPEDFEPANEDAGELETLRAEVAALKEQMLRVAADAENAKRRAERDANNARAYAIEKFAKDLFGAADNLSRAIAGAPDNAEPAVKNFVVGVEMTAKALADAFERNGLKKIEPAPGERFDPHQHQAMMEQPSPEVAGGAVIRTLQAGYELFGRNLRPAMVVVAAKGSGPAAGDGARNPYADGGEAAGAAVDTKA